MLEGRKDVRLETDQRKENLRQKMSEKVDIKSEIEAYC
jgi:hypothetical protein